MIRNSNDTGSIDETLFLTIVKRVDSHLLATKSGLRCIMLVPRVDGTAYFICRRQDTDFRVNWITPSPPPSGAVWRTGRFALDRSAGNIPEKYAEGALRAVRTVVTAEIRKSKLSTLRWNITRVSPETTWTEPRLQVLTDLCEVRGGIRWAAHRLAHLEERPSDLLLSMEGPSGILRFAVTPREQPPAEDAERILEQATFALWLLDDPGPVQHRQILANQPERFLGFLLSRLLWKVKKPAANPPAHPPETEYLGPDYSDLPAVAKEMYLYLNRSVCDASCIFCSRSLPEFKERIKREIVGFDYQAELRTIEKGIESYPYRECFKVGGHEPAIYPTILPILDAAKRTGFERITLETNGIALADETLADAVSEAGVNHVEIPIYGASPETHETIVGVPGSFAKQLKAVQNLKRRGITVKRRSVLLRQNQDQMAELLSLCPDLGITFVMPVRNEPGEYERLCPKLSSVPRSVIERINSIYLPCISGDSQQQRGSWSHDLGFVSPRYGEFIYQGEEQNLSEEQRLQRLVKLEKCRRCSQEERCSGIYAMYFQVHGVEEFKPI